MSDGTNKRRSVRTAKESDPQRKADRSYRHDDLGDLSSESEWSSDDETSARTCARRENVANQEMSKPTRSTTRRSARTGKPGSQKSNGDRVYQPDDLCCLSSESEWNSNDESSSSEDDDNQSCDLEVVVSMKRVSTKPATKSVASKSTRKRAPPCPTPSTTKAKRPKLSLSTRKKRDDTNQVRKVRTVEKKRTASSTRRTGELATPSSRRKVVTPHIPERKKVALPKSGGRGGRTSQFEEAKQRYTCTVVYYFFPCTLRQPWLMIVV